MFVITSSGTGGAESALRELASRLDRKRFRPQVCSLLPVGSTGNSLAEAGVSVTSLKMAERPRVLQLVTGGSRLSRMIDRFEVDLVQGFLYRANVLASIGSLLSLRRPVLVTSQRSLEPLEGRLAVWSAEKTRRFSRRIVAVSRAVREGLLTNEGLSPERVVVIPNGVDTEHYRRRARSVLRQRMAIGAGTLLVGAAGRLTTVKGFEFLLKAIGRLHQAGLDIKLVIAGDGPNRAGLAELADRLGIGSETLFLGTYEDMVDFYSALDVFVLTSLREGSPNVLLEAMACGCASVATSVGGVPEIVDDGTSGILVPPADTRRLADELAGLATNASLRRELAVRARQRVDSHYAIAHTVRAYEKLYSALLVDRLRPEACGPRTASASGP